MKTNMWYGLGVENIFYGENQGILDTWDAWWMASILENDGLCLNPYKSYIRNVGFDGSGTNCGGGGASSQYDSELQTENSPILSFPLDECVEDAVRRAFAKSDWGSALAYQQISGVDKKQNKAVVYGVGNGLRKYEYQISQFYEVLAFVDRTRKGFYAGLDIVRPDSIKEYLCNDKDIKILITLLDVDKGNDVKRRLIMDYGIDDSQIIVLSQ